MTTDELRRQLEFYQDLGIKQLYRRTPVLSEMKPINIEIPLPSLVPDGDTLDREDLLRAADSALSHDTVMAQNAQIKDATGIANAQLDAHCAG